MGKFAKKSQGTKTVNRAGGKAYKQSDKLALVSLLLTSFLKDQAYRSGDAALTQLVDCVQGLPDKKFAAKAALFARKEFGMRSVSQVVAGEIAKSVHGETWTKSFFEKIVTRPDDMMEILAYLYSTGLTTEPNALKKGFAKALEKMSEHALAKYKYEGKSVSLIDVVNLVHPKHTEALASLIKGTLKPAETWEVRLSSGENKARVWQDLISEGKIGHFALLRNLRNILKDAPDAVDLACQELVNPEKIKKSLVLPFRYLTAIKEIMTCGHDQSRKVLQALNQAVDISLNNVPKFKGTTLIALDVSGSMTSMGGKPAEIGALFSAMLYKANNADLITFDGDARYCTLNPSDSTLTLAQSIPFTGGSTNFHSIFQAANKAYDRIIILSDMQGWVGYHTPTVALSAYKNRFNKNPWIYSFDLQGYGDMQFPESQVACLAGFSEKVFDLMAILEDDKNALIHKIESIEL